MLKVNYTMTAQENAEATLDFLLNRPFMNFMFMLMKYSCLLLCIGFGIATYNKAARPQDAATVIFALLWIIFYKSINRWVVKSALRNRRYSELKPEIKIDSKGLLCTGQTSYPLDVKWKSLRRILKTKNGYIIPLTGIRNAGKFLWLPFRCFSDESSEQQFIELSTKNRIKIKQLK